MDWVLWDRPSAASSGSENRRRRRHCGVFVHVTVEEMIDCCRVSLVREKRAGDKKLNDFLWM